MKGANGSLKRRTLQSVEQDTATSPLGAMEIPFTAPADSQHMQIDLKSRRLLHVTAMKLNLERHDDALVQEMLF